MEHTKELIVAMTEDVTREAKGEIIESIHAVKAIGKRTAVLFKERLKKRLYE